jgi:hypothetical protein
MPTLRLLLPLTVLLLAACQNEDDKKGRIPISGEGAMAEAPAELPPGMTPAAAANLDSGNVAFRVKQYEVAQQYYMRAATIVPQQAAPWYGVYMVAQATSNQKLADSAMKMVSQRTGGGDLMTSELGNAHAGGGTAGTAGPIAPGTPMPKGHPAVPPQ